MPAEPARDSFLPVIFWASVPPVSPSRTLRAYSATLAVFVAYTAVEQIGKLTDTQVTSWRIDEPMIAAGLRAQMSTMNKNLTRHLSMPNSS